MLVEYQNEFDYYSETTKSPFFKSVSAAFFGVMTSLAYHLTVGLPLPDPDLVGAKFVGSIEQFMRGVDGSEAQLTELADNYQKIVQILFTKSSFEKAMSAKMW